MMDGQKCYQSPKVRKHMSLALQYQRRADIRLAQPRFIMATIDHKSRSPSPRVIETSPVIKQSRPIATIDYNERLVDHLKREMSEPKFSPRLNNSFVPSPALITSAKKQDRELSSWLYNTTMSST